MQDNNYRKRIHESRQLTIKEWKEYYVRTTKGRARRQRDKSISDKLHEVHKPYHQRQTEDTIQNNGTILFDLSQYINETLDSIKNTP